MTQTRQDELKKEIESTRAIIQTYLPSDMDIDKMPSSEVLEFAMEEEPKQRDMFLIYWKDYKFLIGKEQGITETNSKWKEAVQKLKENYIPMPASDFVNFVDKIFGELI